MSGDLVVIGVGNDWRRDDGAGPEVARRLRSRLGGAAVVVELDGEPARLVEAWDGATSAVVVDAVRTGAEGGTVHVIDPSAAGSPVRVGQGHGAGLGEAVRLGAALGRMPQQLHVIGIEPADTRHGRGLSPPVELAVDRVVDQVLALVAAIEEPV